MNSNIVGSWTQKVISNIYEYLSSRTNIYYSQMVWADTEAVGCGFMTTRDVTLEQDIAWVEKQNGTQNYVESVRNVLEIRN